MQRLAPFGSVVRGQARPDSDVDLLVQFSPGAKTYDRFLALSELLEAARSRRVELVTVEALSPFLGPHILAEAGRCASSRSYLRHILAEAAYLINRAAETADCVDFRRIAHIGSVSKRAVGERLPRVSI